MFLSDLQCKVKAHAHIVLRARLGELLEDITALAMLLAPLLELSGSFNTLVGVLGLPEAEAIMVASNHDDSLETSIFENLDPLGGVHVIRVKVAIRVFPAVSPFAAPKCVHAEMNERREFFPVVLDLSLRRYGTVRGRGIDAERVHEKEQHNCNVPV